MNCVGQESNACIQKLHASTKNLIRSQGLIKNTGQSQLLTPLLQLLLAAQAPSKNVFSQCKITGEKHQVFGQLLHLRHWGFHLSISRHRQTNPTLVWHHQTHQNHPVPKNRTAIPSAGRLYHFTEFAGAPLAVSVELFTASHLPSGEPKP